MIYQETTILFHNELRVGLKKENDIPAKYRYISAACRDREFLFLALIRRGMPPQGSFPVILKVPAEGDCRFG